VSIINYQTGSVTQLFTGWQPHGLYVDDHGGVVFVANRNVNPAGPPAHHGNTCGGKNGYVTLIDMNTGALVPGFKTEVSVDPFAVSIRE
jgi:DNA-binding beta-propeller fold protein YncE